MPFCLPASPLFVLQLTIDEPVACGQRDFDIADRSTAVDNYGADPTKDAIGGWMRLQLGCFALDDFAIVDNPTPDGFTCKIH